MRTLSENFMKALQTGGVLRPVLEYVQKDATLNLEIRDAGKVTIYYRGGILVELRESSAPSQFKISFTTKYLVEVTLPNWATPLPTKVETAPGADSTVAILPLIKQAIDRYLARKKDNREKECQQLIVRENNLGLGKETDYFICDTENDQRPNRFDMVAAKWPFKNRRETFKPGLALIELKFGHAAVTDKAGICDHYIKLNEFLLDRGKLQKLKEDMTSIFAQKKALGLINVLHPFAEFDPKVPMEYILILANYDPDKSGLAAELSKLAELERKNTLPVEDRAVIMVATSNYMGYGLFEESICTLSDFLKEFPGQTRALTAPH